jgi:hypothetical protein
MTSRRHANGADPYGRGLLCSIRRRRSPSFVKVLCACERVPETPERQQPAVTSPSRTRLPRGEQPDMAPRLLPAQPQKWLS